MNHRQTFGTDRDIYRLKDKKVEGENTPALQITSTWEEADEWNKKFFGIFWTVNVFNQEKRVKDNCKKILSWAIDLDAGSKQEQLAMVRKSLLIPSLVVEARRGYHFYWNSIDARTESHKPIMDRMIEVFNADKKAADICRILRVPGFYHHKEEPFVVRVEYSSSKAYTEKEIWNALGRPKKTKTEEHKREWARICRSENITDTVFDKVWYLDCEQALMKISGTDAMFGETVSFVQNSNGNKNIHINGKGTSCWIDKDKRIGSYEKGGPTIFQWLDWYHKDKKKSFEYIKKYFPEVVGGK